MDRNELKRKIVRIIEKSWQDDTAVSYIVADEILEFIPEQKEFLGEEEIANIISNTLDINAWFKHGEGIYKCAKALVGYIPSNTLDEYEILNIIEKESKLDPDFHGITMQKIAKVLSGKIAKQPSEPEYCLCIHDVNSYFDADKNKDGKCAYCHKPFCKPLPKEDRIEVDYSKWVESYMYQVETIEKLIRKVEGRG